MEPEKILGYAERIGAEQCEIFEYNERDIQISISKFNEKTSASSVKSHGIGMRVLVNGKEGFSYFSNVNPKNIEKSVKNAIVLAKKGGRELKSLPEPKKIREIPSLYHEHLSQIDEDELFNITRKVFEKSLKYEGLGRLYRCNNNVRSVDWSIINSLGLNYELKETHNRISYSTIASKNDRTITYSDSIYDRRLIDVDHIIDKIIETIKYNEKCVSKKGINIKTGEYMAILSPILLGRIFRSLLYSQVLADFHPRQIKPNDIVGSKKISIIEDPFNPKIPGSSPIDHEGTPAKEKIIVDNGKLNTLLYDQYYAEKENVESTGNGFRTPIRIWPKLMKPYQAMPTPQISSARIESGKKDLEELVSQVQDGVYMDSIVGGGADPKAGIFTATAVVAFKIEEGEMKNPIRHATITGHITDLSNIMGLTEETKLIWNTLTPTVLIPKINIAGSK
jgi:PmbA protein